MKTGLLTKSIAVSAVAFAFFFAGCNSAPTAVQGADEISTTGAMLGDPPAGINKQGGGGDVFPNNSVYISKKGQTAELKRHCPNTFRYSLWDDKDKEWKVTFKVEKIWLSKQKVEGFEIVKTDLRIGHTCVVKVKALKDNLVVPANCLQLNWTGTAIKWSK